MVAKRVGVALITSIILLVSTNYVASQQTTKKSERNKAREVERYIQLLEDPNPTVRKQAAIALGDISRSIRKALQLAITDENEEVRAAVAEALETKDKPAESKETTGSAVCQTCKGKGQYDEKCRRCKGTGEEKCLGCNGSGKDKDFGGKEINCYGCKGTGKKTCDYFACRGAGTYKEQCPECHGSGKTASR